MKDVIPDLQARVDHILTRQVFGIAITGEAMFNLVKGNGPRRLDSPGWARAGNARRH